jgi:hypothetical protein
VRQQTARQQAARPKNLVLHVLGQLGEDEAAQLLRAVAESAGATVTQDPHKPGLSV